MLLDETLQSISPEDARNRGFFGPLFHGTTQEKLNKINAQGFNVFVSPYERTGETSHGFDIRDFHDGIPAPIHFLGFGIYFSTVKAIAKQFGYGNTNIGPYFIDAPRMETINWGSSRTMMKWLQENGYDMEPISSWKVGQTGTYGDVPIMGKIPGDDISMEEIRRKRFEATIHLTDTLKSKYDAVWYKGKGMYRLLDGDQVCVYDPNRIYRVDKSLIKPGEIGSKVIAKIDIDPFGRGQIVVPSGTKGIIIDKKKPNELQKWAEGSKWIYVVAWEKGGKMWGVLDQWIEPYVSNKKRKLSENKTNEEIKSREEFALKQMEETGEEYDKEVAKKWKSLPENIKKMIYLFIEYEKQIESKSVRIEYGRGSSYTQFGAKSALSRKENKIRKIVDNVIPNFWVTAKIFAEGEGRFERFFPKKMYENDGLYRRNFWKLDEVGWNYESYLPISKKEEDQVVDYIKKYIKNNFSETLNDYFGKTFKKIKDERKVKLGSTMEFDIIDYEAHMGFDGVTIFHIRKTNQGVGFSASTHYNDDDPDNWRNPTKWNWKMVIPPPQKQSIKEEIDNNDIEYYPISKREEDEVVNFIKLAWKEDNIGKTLHKINHDIKLKVVDKYYDFITYEGEDTKHRFFIFTITKSKNGVGYYVKSKISDQIYQRWTMVIPPKNQSIKEGNEIEPGKQHDCFNNARRWALHNDDGKTYVVHGKVTNIKGKRFNYAWVEKKDNNDNFIVIDPTQGVKLDKKKWYKLVKAYPESIYTALQATQNMMKSGNLDPWTKEEIENRFVWRNDSSSIKESDDNESEDNFGKLYETEYWNPSGLGASGALILARNTGRLLFMLRSKYVNEPNTYGVIGGAIDKGETPESSAIREIEEETGYQEKIEEMIPLYVYEDKKSGFRYSNFLAIIPREFDPQLDWETSGYRWVKFGEWPSPLHFGLKALIAQSGLTIKGVIEKIMIGGNNVNCPKAKAIGA